MARRRKYTTDTEKPVSVSLRIPEISTTKHSTLLACAVQPLQSW